MSNMYERYWIYSRTQMEKIISANEKAGRPTPTFGTVIVNGVHKIYTDKITDMSHAPFADSILLIKGDERKIKYTNITF